MSSILELSQTTEAVGKALRNSVVTGDASIGEEASLKLCAITGSIVRTYIDNTAAIQIAVINAGAKEESGADNA